MLEFPEKKSEPDLGWANFYGWIMYTKEESLRNKSYIDLYRHHGREVGILIELVLYMPNYECQYESGSDGKNKLNSGEEYESDFDRKLEDALACKKPDFVIQRTRDAFLSRQLESAGIRVFNHSQIADLGNDKWKAYQFMESRGIPFLPARLVDSDQEPEDYPLVLKSRSGHGGREVFWLRDREDWNQWKAAFLNRQQGPDRLAGRDDIFWKKTDRAGKNLFSQYLYQRPASNLGRDLRLYVIGNQVVQAVLRTSGEDFRSNFSLGGQARLHRLTDEERQLADRILSHLEIDFAGIDLLYDQGMPVFNELEDMVGARMLYSLTDYDIVEEYISYIKNILQMDL